MPISHKELANRWEQNWKVVSKEEIQQISDGNQKVQLFQEHRVLQSEVQIAAVRSYSTNGITKPPLVMLHGFAQNRFTWQCSTRSVSAFFASLGFDVWNVELRGHGLSRRDGQIGAESFEDYVSDIKIVASTLPDSAFWLGHSLGGATIYAAASTMKPLRCRGIIGLGAIYHFAQDNTLLYFLCRLTNRLFSFSSLGNLQIRTRMGGSLISSIYGLADTAGYFFPISGWWPNSIERDLLEERLQIGFDWTSFEVWKEMSKWAVMEKFPYEKEWKSTDVPLFVVLGDHDHLLSPKDGKVAYDQAGSKDKKLLILNNIDHDRHWGHLDMTIGKDARTYVWKPIAQWMLERI